MWQPLGFPIDISAAVREELQPSLRPNSAYGLSHGRLKEKEYGARGGVGALKTTVRESHARLTGPGPMLYENKVSTGEISKNFLSLSRSKENQGTEMELQQERPTNTNLRSNVGTVKAQTVTRSRRTPLNRSVVRALNIMLDIARGAKPQSFVELRKRHALPKATLHKLLLTLEALNFLRRDEETGKYSIGLAAMEIFARGAASPEDLRSILAPVVEKLVQDWNETCHLGILVGSEEVILKRWDPPEQVVRLATLIGRRHPAYASAGGLAAMAASFDESMLADMPETLPQLTKNTIKSRKELKSRLEEIKKKGYALDLEEAYLGVRCVGVAASVPDWPVVHLSFSLPLQRATIERLRELAKPLMAAAKEIENILAVTPRA
jgi:DNA-binding IclR family transcriptional regulator